MATPSQIMQVRRRTADKPKSGDEIVEYAGIANLVLRHKNVSGMVVSIEGQPLPSADYQIDGPGGIVSIINADSVQAGNVLQFTYEYTAYGDLELSTMIDQYGERGAVVEIINDLLADSARMFDYSEGGTEMRQSQIFSNLRKLLDLYIDSSTGTVKNDQPDSGFSVMQRDFGEPRYDTERDISRQDC